MKDGILSAQIQKQLADEVTRAITVQAKIEALSCELKLLAAGVKTTLIAASLRSFSTPAGEAALQTNTALSWDVSKLKDQLSKERFSELVPPTPCSKDLKALLEILPAKFAKELRACATAQERVSLVFVAAPVSAGG